MVRSAAGGDRRHRVHRPGPRPGRPARRRPAGRRWPRPRRESGGTGGPGARRRAGRADGRGAGRGRRHRRRPHLHARTTCTSRWPSPPWRPASTSSARSRWRSTPPARPRIADAAAAAGRVVAVPFVYRFHPMVRQARALVAAGDLGTASACSTAATSRTGCRRPTTTAGGSTPPSAGRRGRSPTSARTGATWSSSSPATGSPGCWPGPDHGRPGTGRRVARPSPSAPAAGADRRRASPGRAPRTWPWCCSRPTAARSGRSS